MIKLTEKQRQELSAVEPTAIDPRTGETYVLVRTEAYERLKALVAQDEYNPDGGAAYINEAMAEDDANDPFLEGYQLRRCPTQVGDGRRVLRRLKAEGIPVTAGAWIKESEGGSWFFYIVTRLVTKNGGTRNAYHRVLPVLRQMPQPCWVNLMEIRVISPYSAIGKAIREIAGRRPGPVPLPYGSGRLGGLEIDGAYVYPPVAAAVG